jgi:integrase
MKINKQLADGFNPFLSQNPDLKLIRLSAAILDFLKKKRRELELRTICDATYTDYQQQLKTFAAYLQNDIYLHELSESQIVDFLDNMFIERKVTAYTRNHYLLTIRVFLRFCVQKNYIQTNPAANITNEKNGQKRREIIPDETLKEIFKYLEVNGQDFYLLACWLLYACFIRPSEICGLKISNINFQNQTIFIPAEISKNKKSQVVTIPQNVADFILRLRVWTYPQDFYIVGKDYKPSAKKITEKNLRSFWLKLRKILQFSDKYQFYSLKDTGITRMLNILNIAEVRDQARHSNISITDVYTDRSKSNGNERIKTLNFELRN